MSNQYLFSQWDEPHSTGLLFQAVESCGISWEEPLTPGRAKAFYLCPQWCERHPHTFTNQRGRWEILMKGAWTAWTSWANLLLLLNTKGKCLGCLKYHHPQVALSALVSPKGHVFKELEFLGGFFSPWRLAVGLCRQISTRVTARLEQCRVQKV